MKRNGREKCEIFAKRFFLFAGNHSLLWFQDPTQLICGFYPLQCFNCFRCLLLYSRYKFSCKQNYKNIYTRCFRNNNQRKLIRPSIYKFGLSVCLSICLFVPNKRQNGWTDRAQIFCGKSRDHRKGLWMIKKIFQDFLKQLRNFLINTQSVYLQFLMLTPYLFCVVWSADIL